MADTTITGLPTAVSIDGANDWLPIDTASPNSTNKINRNTLLGVSGQPMDINSTQTVSNKILNNTNSVTLLDGVFTLQDDVDPTKQGRFQLSGITTGNTRTLTWPNSTGTIATLTGTETFTNKTLTSPAITGGTIDNSTITVDSIAGHTSATLGTVYGLSISAGVLNTNNSVITSNIADTAVTPAKLQAGTGTGWTWQSWTPTLANLSGGTITSAIYAQTGKTVNLRFEYTLAGAGMGTAPTFTLPVTASSNFYNSFEDSIGLATYVDAGNTVYYGVCYLSSTTVMSMYIYNTGGTYAQPAAVDASTPFTWGNTDKVVVVATYQAA